jgi:hypothetical protein
MQIIFDDKDLGYSLWQQNNQHETVAVTIPVRDRSLLQELVRKFGWACVF